MHLIKDVENIKVEDREQALSVMNKLRTGNRVFGEPTEGLKKTLSNLELKLRALDNDKDPLAYLTNDGDIRSEIAMIKAGISGEEKLAEYIERVIKYDGDLEDIIFFASLSDPDQDSGNGEYISDSDFVAVYGKNVLILDAKNIRTSPEVPIYLDGNDLVSVGGKPILELHPAVYIWARIFEKYGCQLNSIHGCVVIVNDSGCTVWKNADWKKSEVKPMHISELVNFLHTWILNCDKNSNKNVESSDDDKDDVLRHTSSLTEIKPGSQFLSILTTMAKMQIRKESSGLDLSAARRRFHI